MLQQALLITFREGLESFLIIGVIVAYLRKTGRSSLLRGVHIGLAASVLFCTVGTYFWYRWSQSETSAPNQPLYEGIAALIAAALVGGLLWQTLRAGKRLKSDIENRIERASGGEGAPASLRAIAGVAFVTALLVTREGLEAMLFLGVQAFAQKAQPMVIGAVLGLLAAGAIAWVWSRFGQRLHIGLVLRVTAIFLAIFLLQLVVYGLHELAESGLIATAGNQAFHDATERLGPQGDIGQWITFSLVLAPLLYLALHRLQRRKSPGPPAAATTPPAAADSATPVRRVAR